MNVMGKYSAIVKFEVVRKFKTANGNIIEIIGTISAEKEIGENGYCLCGYGLSENGVCVNCYLNNTVDLIRVNGMMIDGGYRRGTILKMAGLVDSGLNEVCSNDSKVSAEVVRRIIIKGK